MHIDIASFGHSISNDDNPDIRRLSGSQRKQLQALGLIDGDYGSPNWVVKKKYYWEQIFPAGQTVHIRHQYSPKLGSTNSVQYGLGSSADKDMAAEIKSLCVDKKLYGILSQIVNSKTRDAPYSYVDFILTTANTWKTPIEDFTLIVERPRDKGASANYVSFCWDGPVTKVDENHFSAHATDLVPTKELRVGFFAVEPKVF